MVDVALGLVSLIRRFRLGDYKIKRQPLFFFYFIEKKKKKNCVREADRCCLASLLRTAIISRKINILKNDAH